MKKRGAEGVERAKQNRKSSNPSINVKASKPFSINETRAAKVRLEEGIHRCDRGAANKRPFLRDKAIQERQKTCTSPHGGNCNRPSSANPVYSSASEDELSWQRRRQQQTSPDELAPEAEGKRKAALEKGRIRGLPRRKRQRNRRRLQNQRTRKERGRLPPGWR